VAGGVGQDARWALREEQVRTASAPPNEAPDDDLVDKLERLRALRDDDEFAAAKSRLLGRD
jgi:hypothetical protein